MKDGMPWGARGEGYVVVQIFLFIVIFLMPFVGPVLPGWPQPWGLLGRVIGLFMGLAGLVLALTGLRNLGSNLTAVPHPKEDATFVESGAYRFVRHPIYSGIILASFGWAFLTNNYLVLMLSIALFLFF
ncbi:MAG: methyltransferase, partial [Candidatus Promineifilaceae bacterium]|nr:methyltransferase [Candidatus Promineifilaceae bacterium]